MSVLHTNVNLRGEEAKANTQAMTDLMRDLEEKVAVVKQGGGERARERHVGRGKLLPRDRVRTLVDPGAPFLEFSQLAAMDVYKMMSRAAASLPGSVGSLGRNA